MINKDELKNALKLYLVTDSEILKGRDFYKCIEDAIKAGVTMVQLREKNADGKEFLEKAIKLRQITKKYNVTFVINDRVDSKRKWCRLFGDRSNVFYFNKK